MGGRLLFIVAAPLVVAALVYAIGLALRGLGASGQRAAARIRSLIGTVLAIICPIVALSFMQSISAASLALAVLPTVMASISILATMLVDLTWPKPTGRVRSAALSARRPAAPRTLRRLLAIAVTGTMLLLLAGVLTATPNGRALSIDSGIGSTTRPLWPGWYYATPIALGLIVLALLAWIAMRVIDTRPGDVDGATGMDDRARVASKIRVLQSACLGALFTAAPLAIIMGSGLNSIAQTLRMNESPLAHSAPWDWRQNLGFALIVIAFAFVALAPVAVSQRPSATPAQPAARADLQAAAK